jgi:cytidine deaminase
MKLSEKHRQDLWKAATASLPQAYGPYSGVQVGAAVLTEKGQVFGGANVENASYGLSLCAERAAIAVAMAAEGPAMRIRALAVMSDQPGPFAPCGACRQVIYEFGPEALVIFQGEEGLTEAPITDLLPHAFRLQT